MTRDPVHDADWLRLIQRLDAAYSTGGKAALGKMTAMEVYALYNEKIHKLNDVCNHLAGHPHDMMAQLKKQNLVFEANDLADYLDQKNREQRKIVRNKDREMER